MFNRIKAFIIMASKFGKVTDMSVYGLESAYITVQTDCGEIEFSMTLKNDKEETNETV